MADYQEILYDKEAWLGPIRKSELLLYTTLVHIGNQEYKTAKKYISNAIIDHNIKYLPLMRTIRLVRLIVFYEVQEHELIQYESRSITRSLSSPKEQTFKTERIILWRFMNYIIINMKVSFYASLTLRRGWNPKFGKKNCLKSSEHVLAQKNVKE